MYLLCTDGSVHDEDWVAGFVDRDGGVDTVGRSGSGSNQGSDDKGEDVSDDVNAYEHNDDNNTPPREVKLKHSNSNSSLNNLLALV